MFIKPQLIPAPNIESMNKTNLQNVDEYNIKKIGNGGGGEATDVIYYRADTMLYAGFGEQVLKTADKPAQLRLDAWTQSDKPALKADGDDLAFVTVSLVDANGTLVPYATDQLRFEVEGAGQFRAVCNGDATSLEQFTLPTMKLFAGQLVVVVQSAKQKGNLTLKVIDDERKLEKTITLKVG